MLTKEWVINENIVKKEKRRSSTFFRLAK